MNQKRLLKLAEVLRTVDETEFDMQYWKKFSHCGTTCCAFGYACDIPEFQAEGLHWVMFGESYEPAYEKWTGFAAAAKFFDLNMDKSEYLFDGNCYLASPTPNEVADRIVQFLEVGVAHE